MPNFQDIIRQSGKGLDSSKDLIYLLDINIGGTLGDNATGTYTVANLGRDVEDIYYKGKLQNTGIITRSVQPENGQFETSDLSISLANGDLEFSKWPWNYSILNRPSILKIGFSGGSSGGIEYIADCSYLADCSITASGGPLGAGSPGDINVGIAYTLYKGIIKSEQRVNKEFRLSIGDYSNKIFKTIPPRIIKVTEFPNIGTSVMIEGTKTDFETDLIGKPIPYIYGNFLDAPLIHPLFIDTVKKRYLIADHAIGTVIKVFSGGTQVFNFTPNIAGTHTGTHIMSFIDFGTSQGTKQVYAEIKGKVDSYRYMYGTAYNSSDRDVYIAPYNSGVASSYVRISKTSKVNYFGTRYVSVGCWIKQYEPTAARIGFGINGMAGFPQLSSINGTSDAATLGTWHWVSYTVEKTGTQAYWVGFDAFEQNSGVHFDGFKTVIGAGISPSQAGDGTGLISNGDFSNWTTSFGTIAGTRAPDDWVVYQWSHAQTPIITVGGTGFVSNNYISTLFGTLLTNPALILKDILIDNTLCGLSSTDIGTATFDVAEVFLNPFSFRYIMNGEIHKNSIDLIQDISVNSMANFYFDKENKANFDVYRPAVSRTYIRKIEQHEILEDSFSIQRDIRDVYNRVLVNYDYDWIKKEYRNAYEVGGTTYFTQFDTIRTFTIDSPFIYTSTEASYSGRKWLAKLQGGLNKVNFSVPISALPLDIGERIMLSHDEPPTADGGWTNRLINVTEFEIDNRGKTININAIDEDEVNIGQRYFILGDGTAFYRSASEAQRYYGCLASLGGTMSNGDEGYRLW